MKCSCQKREGHTQARKFTKPYNIITSTKKPQQIISPEAHVWACSLRAMTKHETSPYCKTMHYGKHSKLILQLYLINTLLTSKFCQRFSDHIYAAPKWCLNVWQSRSTENLARPNTGYLCSAQNGSDLKSQISSQEKDQSRLLWFFTVSLQQRTSATPALISVNVRWSLAVFVELTKKKTTLLKRLPQ